ncbi:hypothetical protein LCGC14_3043190, partial [marine sediment metagenome]
HDCYVDDGAALGVGVMLAGHVRVETGAVVEAYTGAHHFTTVGRFSRVAACTPVRRDVVPFTVFSSLGYYRASPAERGVHEAGLEAAGLSQGDRQGVRDLIAHLFQAEGALAGKIETYLRRDDLPEPVEMICQFCRRTLEGLFGRHREAFRGRMPPEALEHLLPLPKVRSIVVLHFDSMQAAVASVGTVLSCEPSAAELLDGLVLRLAAQSLEYRNYLDFVVGEPESLVLVEFNGEEPADVQAKADELVEKLKGATGLFHVLTARDKELCDHVWACRKAALPLLLGQPGTRKPVAFVEDAAVAPEHLPAFVERFCEIMARHDTEGAFYGHASVGCLHIRPMLDLRTGVDIDHLQAISR